MKEGSLPTGIIHLILLFLAPIFPLLLSVGVAIAVDTYFGVKLAKKENSYKTRNLRIGLTTKFLTYHLSVISFYIIDYNLLNEFMIGYVSIEFFLTKLLSILFVYIEWESIDETSGKLYNEKFSKKIGRVFRKLKKTFGDVKKLNE